MEANKKIVNNSITNRRNFMSGISKWIVGTTALGFLANIFTSKEAKGDGPRDSIAGGSETWVGEINLVGFNFTPVNFHACDGSLLAISSNSALYALLGTYYGGDGRTTFGVPDLRGRVPINYGSGSGLTSRTIGQTGGTETETLSISQIPSHSHTVAINTGAGDSNSPADYLATNAEGIKQYASTSNSTGSSTNTSGSSLSHNNMPPYLVLNYVMALTGIFPSRS